jgi:acid phosphatase
MTNHTPRRHKAKAALLTCAAAVAQAFAPATAHASPTYLGVAAGDASSTDAVLWTRVTDSGNAGTITSTLSIAANDPTLTTNVTQISVTNNPAADNTAKVDLGGLQPGTRYYYQFSSAGVSSVVGTFKTAPAPGLRAPVHFGFSGDVDGQLRPYTSTANFATNDFDFFVFLGDTIYETASGVANTNLSAKVHDTGTLPGPTSTGATKAQLYADFSRKYDEQFGPVNPGGQPGLQAFFAAQGNYTLYDNHELGNKQYINGGAPAGGPVGDSTSGAGVDARLSTNDVTPPTGPFMNKATGFQLVAQAYLDHEPVKDRGIISASTDLRTDGTPRLFFAQQWGKNAVFVNVDDRTYRDIRMKTSSNADDTGARGGNTNRTMLGATQLAWLESTLLNAQRSGTTWKFVAISSPIDQLGPIGGGFTGLYNPGTPSYSPVASDGGKSWMGQYRAERNALLKFIADNGIQNVVFLTTDDHQNRVNELTYSATGQTENQATYVKVPYCFQIVDGPMGATGPDLITNHAYANLKSAADSLAAAQSGAGIDPIGLDPKYPGLHNVWRENDPQADTVRQPIDFYSPDTFNYTSLDVSEDGKTLAVTVSGLNSYAVNTFPESSVANPVRPILGFQIDAPSDSLAAIDHFIVIYQENWSFDGLYGSFPGANGIANASAASLNQIDRLSGNAINTLANYDPASRAIPTQNPPVPLNGSNVQDPRFLMSAANTNGPLAPGLNTLLPYDLTTYLTPSDLTGDIVHRYWQEILQINGGLNNAFITWSDNPGLVMSHFDATSLPEGQLAQQYVMCDNFFHSAFGGSFLNHQFLIAAQAPVYTNAAAIIPNNVARLDAEGVLALNVPGNGRITLDGNITPIGGVVVADPSVKFDKNYAVNTIFSHNLAASGNPDSTALLPSQNDSNPADTTRPYIKTIGDALSEANVSWKWYSGGWSNAIHSSPSDPSHRGTTLTTVSPLFQWHHQAFAFYDNYAPWLANGQQNPVSQAHLQDENVFFSDVADGKLPAVSFIKPLGPDNEHPGYASLQQGQQHVANIVAAVQANADLWAHTAIIVTYDEHGGRWDHVTPPARDIWGPGVRVPGIIISPLSKKGVVDHSQYETLSILKTIEQRFGLQPLTAADAAAQSFAPAFDSTQVNVPAAVRVFRGGFIRNRRTGYIHQDVRLVNTGSTPVVGPINLALDGLSANATLVGGGFTSRLAPLNSPYVNVNLPGGRLNQGASVTVTLQFADPTLGGITYTTRVLAGVTAP